MTSISGRRVAEMLEVSLRQRGFSENTIKNRCRVVQQLDDVGLATRDDIMAVVSRPEKLRSRRLYLMHLRQAYADLIEQGVVERDPTVGIRFPRIPKDQPRPLTQLQVERLIVEPKFRVRAWTMLGAFAGLRASEVTRITPQDLVVTDQGYALRVIGKGRKEATIPAHHKIVDLLLDLEPFRDALWPIAPSRLSQVWSKAASDLGMPGLRFHQCRHFFGTQVLRTTGNLLVTRDLMRHNSVATTEVYAKVIDDAGFRAVAGF
jgi:integrase/recombinase XerD